MSIGNKRLETEKEQKDIIRGLRQFGIVEYEIQKYTASLQSLVISLTPIVDAKHLFNNRNYLLFTGVSYLQIVPFWRDGHFNWIEHGEKTAALKNLGCKADIKNPVRVVNARSDARYIWIVFNSVFLFDTMPKFGFPNSK